MSARKPGRKGITNVDLRAALRKHAGVYALAAKELGCDRSNVASRVGRSPALKAYCVAIEQEVGDAAEAVIKHQIIKGDGRMARWYAELKLKDRGYVRRQEVTGADGAPIPAATIKVNVTYVDAPKRPDDEDVI